MHGTLDWFIKISKEKLLNEKSLIKKFNELLEKEALSKIDKKELEEKGVKTLKLLYKKVIPNWPKNIQSEMNIKGVKLAENLILNGRLDMIEILSKDGLVIVHDFKTGRIKSRSQIDGSKETSGYNYKRQLTFYKILLDKYKDGMFKTKVGIIDFIEPDEKGNFKKEIFEITENDTKELEQVIKIVAEQIMNLTFWDTKCDDESCQYCRLREMVF